MSTEASPKDLRSILEAQIDQAKSDMFRVQEIKDRLVKDGTVQLNFNNPADNLAMVDIRIQHILTKAVQEYLDKLTTFIQTSEDSLTPENAMAQTMKNLQVKPFD